MKRGPKARLTDEQVSAIRKSDLSWPCGHSDTMRRFYKKGGGIAKMNNDDPNTIQWVQPPYQEKQAPTDRQATTAEWFESHHLATEAYCEAVKKFLKYLDGIEDLPDAPKA
jgi:hypothetical protein